MANPLNETRFEDVLFESISSSYLYNARKPKDFNQEFGFDLQTMQSFIEATQPQEWKKLEREFPKNTIEAVAREFTSLRSSRGLLSVLRFGFTLKGAKLKFIYFKPVSGFNEEHKAKYELNRFSVIRQFQYNEAHHKEIDLAILINGIPIITMELKNEGSGQNVYNAIQQYSNPKERDHNDLVLKNCLVHFAVDNQTVFMTTKLQGKNTYFLPFNRDTKNPNIDGKFASSYLWDRILQADSLLNILQNFVMHQKDDKGNLLLNKPIIFPRYHQLDVVRTLLADVREDGAGTNYLIQHSAGSGKSKSIAWLAHQLSNLFDENDQKIFDSIIVITDRKVLDQQLQKDILEFEKTKGVVETIGKGKTSKDLVKALEGGRKIIVSTLQKFGTENVAKIADMGNKRFAIIVDEAHSSQTGENVKDLKVALTSDQQISQILDDEGYDSQDALERELEKVMKQRQKLPHLSFFAFTATPKEKTFQLFGIPAPETKSGYRARHVYSMRQAIEEGFILNVLDNYTTYGTYFELVEKNNKNKNDEFEKGKARRLLLKEVGLHPHTINQKSHVMLNHFMENTIHKINGRGKAMVITSSRAHAVLYKKEFDKILKEEYNNNIGVLVAFSGDVLFNDEDYKYNESNMNPKDVKDIKKAFEDDRYRILIVANKFQTGFDQPLLHTMYVEKALGGVATVQTLSRLNRIAPPYKKDTMVLDFVNDAEQVKLDFQDYYQATTLDKGVDTQKLYNQKFEIEQYNTFDQTDIDNFIELFILKKVQVDRVSSLIKKVVDDGYLRLSDEDKAIFRKKMNSYVRSYSFISQVITYIDTDLEKFYLFVKLLYKYLPYEKETLPREVTELVDMDKYALVELPSRSMTLEKTDGELKHKENDGHNGNKESKKDRLEVIVTEINEQFGYEFKNFHRVIKNVQDHLSNNESLKATMSAKDIGDVKRLKFNECMQEALLENIDDNMQILSRMEEDKGFGKYLLSAMFEWYKNNI